MSNVLEFESSASPLHETDSLLKTVLNRLTAILHEENGQLENGAASDHSNYINTKNQILRELMALQRNIDFKSLAPDMLEQLGETRKLVDRNHQLLKLQVSALNDVTSFLTKAAIAEQGDGTYTRERQ